MNPNVDLGSFRRGSPASVIVAPGTRPGAMVAPPRRFFTRYVVPGLLLAGFAGVGLYAARGSLQPTVPVRIVLPMVANLEVQEATNSVSTRNPSTDSNIVVPEAHRSVHGAAGPSVNYVMPVKGEALMQAPGWVEPEPYKTVVPALQTGHVKALHVLEGQRVSSGTLIAELVEDDALLAVEQAEASVALKQAMLDAAKADWENPISLKESIKTLEAQAVQLAAEKDKAAAQLELSTKEAAAGKSLSQSGYEAGLENFKRQAEARGSRSQVQEIEARQRQNEAALSAARDRLRLRIEDRQRLQTAEAEVKMAKAELAEARLMLERTKIHAHTEGVIMQVHVSPGAMLMEELEQGMQVVTMYNPEHLQVRVDVPVSEAAKLRPGLPAEVRVDALPDKVYQGVLTRIVPQADVQRNVLPVKVHLFSPDDVLQPEMLAKVQFFTAGKSSQQASTQVSPIPTKKVDMMSTSALSSNAKVAVLVPQEVLHEVQNDTAIVWLAGPDNRAMKRQVTLGSTRDGMRIVKEGVEVADRIIASNTEKLRDDIRIRIEREKQ